MCAVMKKKSFQKQSDKVKASKHDSDKAMTLPGILEYFIYIQL